MRRSFWLLPDPHFGHTKLETLHREKGFEEKIFKNIKRLPKQDILIVLGDFMFKKHGFLEHWEKIVSDRIVWLVRGNHDNETVGWYLDHGFCVVADEIKIQMYGINILLTHIPVKRNDYDINIHGHLHGNGHRSNGLRLNQKNCSVFIEGNGYAPIKLQSVAQSHMAKLEAIRNLGKDEKYYLK